jgi:hypothetical protein
MIIADQSRCVPPEDFRGLSPPTPDKTRQFSESMFPLFVFIHAACSREKKKVKEGMEKSRRVLSNNGDERRK